MSLILKSSFLGHGIREKCFMKNKMLIEDLKNVVTRLRNPKEGCPWDKEQTFESLSQLTIEETFELFEAIINDNKDEIKSELGDLLMHIILYSKIASEKQSFDIGDVIETVIKKIIFIA